LIPHTTDRFVMNSLFTLSLGSVGKSVGKIIDDCKFIKPGTSGTANETQGKRS